MSSSLEGIGGSSATQRFEQSDRTTQPSDSSATSLMPLPADTGDDLMTSIAILTMKQKQGDRVAADQQRGAAEKAQEEAQQRKIDKMRELARDTFTEGLVGGILEGASAAVTAASAVDEFEAGTKGALKDAKEAELSAIPEGDQLSRVSTLESHCATLGAESRALARDAKLLDAASKGLSATSRLGTASAKAAQEDDRADIATADRDVDHAKSSVDAASTASRRADDDIRETLNAIRQYVAAKTQLGNAAIIKG